MVNRIAGLLRLLHPRQEFREGGFLVPFDLRKQEFQFRFAAMAEGGEDDA
jgi:hypothetical protein